LTFILTEVFILLGAADPVEH